MLWKAAFALGALAASGSALAGSIQYRWGWQIVALGGVSFVLLLLALAWRREARWLRALREAPVRDFHESPPRLLPDERRSQVMRQPEGFDENSVADDRFFEWVVTKAAPSGPEGPSEF